MKFAQYVAQMLHCKHYKFCGKNCHSGRDIEFFLGVTFSARPTVG